MLHDHTLLIHGSQYIYMQPSSFNKAVSHAHGKVGMPRRALKDVQLITIQHIYTARTCLYGYRQIWQVHMHESYCLYFVPYIHFGKAESAYRHHRHASYGSAWCSCTLQSYILPNISPCYYRQVQLTYLDELYGECSGTARACANSGYRSLIFSSA